ncbi:MAG: hypothetical protein NUV78_00160 [Candidatus Zambryskibacteria bacterium]|nr:hypothetical protein [Candidatus Zambryskibacteria bacterium]
MDTILNNKKAIVAVVVLLLVFYVYSAFVGPALISESNGPDTPADTSLVKLSEELEGITFRQDLFSVTGYRALVDFSVDLPETQAGRPNPFEIIGRD